MLSMRAFFKSSEAKSYNHGRLVSSMIFGVIVALFVVINRLIPGIGPQETLPFFGGAAVIFVLLALCLLYFRISVQILAKKEF